MRMTNREIGYINALETISGAQAKYCLVDSGEISFLVREGQAGKAIGKQGVNIKKLRETLGKEVGVFEYAESPEGFLRKAFRSIEIGKVEMTENEGVKTLFVTPEPTNKRKLLQNIGKMKKIRVIMKEVYGIGNVKVR